MLHFDGLRIHGSVSVNFWSNTFLHTVIATGTKMDSPNFLGHKTPLSLLFLLPTTYALFAPLRNASAEGDLSPHGLNLPGNITVDFREQPIAPTSSDEQGDWDTPKLAAVGVGAAIGFLLLTVLCVYGVRWYRARRASGDDFVVGRTGEARYAEKWQSQHPPNSTVPHLPIAAQCPTPKQRGAHIRFESVSTDPPVTHPQFWRGKELVTVMGAERRLHFVVPGDVGSKAVCVQSNLRVPVLAGLSKEQGPRKGLGGTGYFEVHIEKIAEGVVAGVGYASKPYPPFRLPGLEPHSVAIHTDKGEIRASRSANGKERMIGAARRLVEGDVIGCGYTVSSSTPGQAHAFFTLNGIRLPHTTRPEHPLGTETYACVGANGSCVLTYNFTGPFLYQGSEITQPNHAPAAGLLKQGHPHTQPEGGARRGAILDV
eukprot:comp21620_c0_seq1/m.30324 comp21620_c0_seq1/g.30324  ORF comp21620_c0_seq1/g.30324 comp21620_c0_seq1/m.30324 type:complete len:428 (-) comp21620_c0_seq1:732-2015(-)